MSWIKRLFSKKKKELIVLGPKNSERVIDSNLTFKEKMRQNIIPWVWQMAKKEKEHLIWLMDNNAPQEMIEDSQKYLDHYRQRHREYNEYITTINTDIKGPDYKIVVWLNADYSSADEFTCPREWDKFKITEEVDKRYSSWVYYDIW